ncbi:MAG: VOC family protein [Planctomycetota bacterium]|nr:VOC family protein [Planctomycetota bacterium]
MKMPSLGHVGLSVSDLERSKAFYRDVIGMQVVLELDISDDRQARVIGAPGTKCRIVHMKLGDGVIELFEYYGPDEGKNVAHDLKQWDKGLVHIGFEVNDFHKRVETLRRHDVEFLGEPVEFRPGVWVLYFCGPDGEICELHDVSQAKG